MRRDDYWDGALWLYQADITNNGSNSGNHKYSVVPGAGNEMEFLYGVLSNADTSARTAQCIILDAAGGNIIQILRSLSLAAGDDLALPNLGSGSDGTPFPTRYIVAGIMAIEFNVLAVATSQDSALGAAFRIRGGVPTVTLTSPTDAVEVVNTNQVF